MTNKSVRWQLTIINDEPKMSKANFETQEVEVRDLYWWEHFRFFWRLFLTGVLR